MRILYSCKLLDRIMEKRFSRVIKDEYVFFYAGDIPQTKEYTGKKGIVGLSIQQFGKQHIGHDITKPFPIPDCSIDKFQAEDVFEHIEFDKLHSTMDEIYRILKPGGVFRLSVPDYRCDVLLDRVKKNEDGDIVFDPYGGGAYENGQVIKGGHVWFPTYEKVLELISESLFSKYHFYHYYDESGNSVTEKIDYSIGYIKRTPDHDERVKKPYRAMSIVVDMYK